jgi:hypothetical protein
MVYILHNTTIMPRRMREREGENNTTYARIRVAT